MSADGTCLRYAIKIWWQIVWPIYLASLLLGLLQQILTLHLLTNPPNAIFNLLPFFAEIIITVITVHAVANYHFKHFRLGLDHPGGPSDYTVADRHITWWDALGLLWSIVWRGLLFQVPIIILTEPYLRFAPLSCLSNDSSISLLGYYCSHIVWPLLARADYLFLIVTNYVLLLLLLLAWLPAVWMVVRRRFKHNVIFLSEALPTTEGTEEKHR